MQPEAFGIDRKYIRAYLEMLDREQISMHSMLLSKGNDIFFECYWKPFHREFLHRMYSVTKSVVAIGIGFLLQDGKVKLDDAIGIYFPEEIKNSNDKKLKTQTIRDMLMMSTARMPRNGGNWFACRPEDRVAYYFEDSEANSRIPGTIWEYDSTGSFILGALIERESGKSLKEYMQEKLFDKIGVSKEAYFMNCPGGHAWADSGFMCTAQDIWKIGRFMLNGGSWNGEQLLDASYVKEAVGKQIDNDVWGNHDWNCQGYGYQIWKTYQDSFMFYGMGGQLIICVPHKDLIFVCNGDNQGNEAALRHIVQGFFEYIVGHLEDGKIGTTEDAAWQTYTSQLKLYAARGEKMSSLETKINDVTYELEENPMGITKMRFVFEKEKGTLYYTNKQGDKEIVFGRCENEFGYFPEEGYSDMTGSVKAAGNRYYSAVSGAWTMRDSLLICVQIIDKYFGRLNIHVGFQGEYIGIQMNKCAEDFMETYEGYAYGKTAERVKK